MDSNQKKHNLFLGLLAIIFVIVIVALIGFFVAKPEPLILQGEAEATEYRISGKLPGRIEHYLVEEGDHVKAGDTLVILDSPEIKAKLAQAQAAKAAAAAQSRKAIKGARSEQIMGAYEMWQKAKVGVDITKKSLDRVQSLFDKGVMPAQKRDEVEAQYNAAVATEKAAKSQYDMAVNGAQAEDKEAAQALVERAEGAIMEVESYMNEIYLKSPIDGEVANRFPKHGELVGTGAPIMTIVDMEDIWLTFNVREDLLQEMTMGSIIDVKVPALGEELYPAKIVNMKAMASYATWRTTKTNGQFDVKTFEIIARPEQPIANLRPGMSAIIERIEKEK
ncbi:MAG: efflux RND transporter periplasmic adaptor subunit [Bacteroidales bacterium]|nr:efflux RND transporter periplasmic adaptor subunit [Bacteroidales bacterium]